ncbi:MAG: DUF523 domain-containing protein [Clostridia bacterium]|nr:DUF523 domain-containing protein [Clostridia bacterium]
MEKMLVSACLLGVSCRYDGKSKGDDRVKALMDKYDLIPICPEIMGGMPTPRVPSEIKNGRVYGEDGNDVTEYFKKGAEEVLSLAKLYGCKRALLKENSPSCGFGKVYDGSFSKKLVEGNGIASDLLYENGIEIFGEESIDRLM